MFLLHDIYSVHKAMNFGLLQRAEYNVDDFRSDIQNAERNVSGENVFSKLLEEQATSFNLSLFPTYLVKDNVFEVMACHFAVSAVVNEMKSMWTNTNKIRVRSVVVPSAVCSRYDSNDIYQPSINNMDEFMKNSSLKYHHVSRQIRSMENADAKHADDVFGVSKLSKMLMKMVQFICEDFTENVLIVFNRERVSESGAHTVWILQCSDFSDFAELKRNYNISFDFDTSSRCIGDERLIRCWLTFGVGQPLRFYPEYAIWIIPTLFARSTTMKTHKMVQTLYSKHYKHGWRVALDDETFNKYYHIITGYEHVSNNYNRDELTLENKIGDDKECGLRDHLDRTLTREQTVILRRFAGEHDFDSDAILGDVFSEKGRIDGNDSTITSLICSETAKLRRLKFAIYRFEHMECKKDGVHHVEDCKHIHAVIQSLQKFEKHDLEIDALNVYDFNLESIINGFDHIIQVHDFLSDEGKKAEIQNYVHHHVECGRGGRCEILRKHSQRARERKSLEEKKEDPLDKVDSLCDAAADILNSVHCYVLHRNKDLYRLKQSGDGNVTSRFATDGVPRQMNHRDEDDEIEEHKDDEKEDDEPLGINFGLNVLQWLCYGQQPDYGTLKDEIIGNPESTIDRALFNNYEIQCVAKIKGKEYTLEEMLCLKLYCDTTELQALLRRAHWTVTPLAVRKKYYRWAMGLYRAHLYHATPIPVAPGKTKPSRLYHGLSRLFTITREMPIYFGPFSTTIAKEVATNFSKNQGLIWMIQSTYANPLRFCIGISMDWISGFKNEREVLLCNQFLPIQKTDTFDDDTGALVNHLVYSLKDRAVPITEPAAFWHQLGTQFDLAWIPQIMSHKLLLQKSKCKGLTVLQRLSLELRISFFGLYGMIRNMFKIDEHRNVILKEHDMNEYDADSDGEDSMTLQNEVNGTDSKQRVLSRLDDSGREFMKKLGNDFMVHVDEEDVKEAMKQYDELTTPWRKAKLLKDTKQALAQKRRERELKQQQHEAQKKIFQKQIREELDQYAFAVTVNDDDPEKSHNFFEFQSLSEFAMPLRAALDVEKEPMHFHVHCRYVDETDSMDFVRIWTLNVDKPLIFGYFLDCLLSRDSPIADSDSFYRDIGVKFYSHWTPTIFYHDLYSKVTQCDGLKIQERLTKELEIPFFQIVEIIRESAFVDEEHVVLSTENPERISIQDFVFAVGCGDDLSSLTRTEIFNDFSQFAIPWTHLLKSKVNSLDIHILCKLADNSFDFVVIHSVVAYRYIFENDSPLVITESAELHSFAKNRHQNGSLLIKNKSDIDIGYNVVINGDGVRESSDGGVIRIISEATIRNQGTLRCNGQSTNGFDGGKGGDIYIVADSFVNDGKMECIPNGRIHVFCREYINNGTMTPNPTVVLSKRALFQSLIDYFLFVLRSKLNRIISPADFYKNIGVHFDIKWIQDVVNHDLLFEPSKYQQQRVIRRMWNELRIKFFGIVEVIRDSAVVNGETICLINQKSGTAQIAVTVTDFVFAVGLGSNASSMTKPHWFKDLRKFRIRWSQVLQFKADSLKLNLLCKAVDDSFDFVQIHSMVSPQYIFESGSPLMISESVKISPANKILRQNGALLIKNKCDVQIRSGTLMNGSGTRRNSDGGVLRIISTGNVRNQGILRCNGLDDGKGGDIYIVAESFVNEGHVECTPNGRIHIFCREYINNGTITPNPKVEQATRALPQSLIDYFLFMLRSTPKRIVSSADFYEKNGVRFDRNWIRDAVNHDLLFKSSKYQQQRVIRRMWSELKIKFFEIVEVIRDSAVAHQEMVCLIRQKSDDPRKAVRATGFVFAVCLGSNHSSMTKPQSFKDLRKLRMRWSPVLQSEADSLNLNILCKAANGSFDFGIVQIHSMVLSEYIFESGSPLIISESVNIPSSNKNLHQNGCLLIKNKSHLGIRKDVIINADGVKENSGGGVIRIISECKVRNQGTLSCNGLGDGEGGDIYIVADSFVNDGKIECIPNGRIYIFCREYTNNGSITPNPKVVRTSEPMPRSMIDYLLSVLQSTPKRIFSAKNFYKEIGLRFHNEWCPAVLNHELYCEKTQYEGVTVKERLVKELKIQFFKIAEVIREYAIVDGDNVVLCCDDYVRADDFVLAIGLGTLSSNRTKALRFGDLRNFSVPWSPLLRCQSDSIILNLFIKPRDGPFDFILSHSLVSSQYFFENDSPLIITESVNVPLFNEARHQSGTLLIKNKSNIEIGTNVVINGNGVKEKNRGGVMRIISSGTVRNEGTLQCNGLGDAKGGDIYIVAGRFVNLGKMKCTPNGRIYIFCREYINNGTIIPNPVVQQTPRPRSQCQIDYLLSVLQSTPNRIVSPKNFYKEIGLRFHNEWCPSVLNHELYCKKTQCEGVTVKERLVKELKIPFFQIVEVIREYAIVDGDNVVICCNDTNLTNVRADDFVLAIGLGTNSSNKTKAVRFGDLGNFSAPWSPLLRSKTTSLNLNLFIKPTDGSFDFILSHSVVASQYICDNDNPLIITDLVKISSVDEARHQSGSLLIKNKSDIEIDSNVTINGDGVRETSEGAKGGVVRFVSNGTLRNEGILRCKGLVVPLKEEEIYLERDFEVQGDWVETDDVEIDDVDRIEPVVEVEVVYDDLIEPLDDVEWVHDDPDEPVVEFCGKGGDIYIVADTFVNDGVVDCTPHGRIHIFCREYINNGTISPKPSVMKSGELLLKDKAFEVNVINYFMTCLQKTSIEITDEELFMRRIGVRLDPRWIQLIADHKLLFEASEFGDKRVIDRLVHELRLPCLEILDWNRHVVFVADDQRVTVVDKEPGSSGLSQIEQIKQEFAGNDQSADETKLDDWMKQFGLYKWADKLKEAGLDSYDELALLDDEDIEDIVDDVRLSKFTVKRLRKGIRAVRCGSYMAIEEGIEATESKQDDEKEDLIQKQQKPRKMMTRISDYYFTVAVSGEDPGASGKVFEFTKQEEISIPIDQALFSKANSLFLGVYCKHKDSSMGYIKMQSVVLPKYVMKRKTPLIIAESVTVPRWDALPELNGDLEVTCSAGIVIEKSCIISAVGTKYFTAKQAASERRDCKDIRERMKQNRRLVLSQWGYNEGAAGGEIRLFSDGDIVNEGVLECTSSDTARYRDGHIVIIAKRFINRGRIHCGKAGSLRIIAKEYKNSGNVSPQPIITKFKGSPLKMMNSRKLSKKEELIPLEIYDFRGCYGHGEFQYHPKRLLQDNSRAYIGQDGPVGDWIMFRISMDKVIVPTRITINCLSASILGSVKATMLGTTHAGNLQSIALWMGKDDGHWFKLCNDIKGIKLSYEKQNFILTLKVSQQQLVMEGNDLLLLEVLEAQTSKREVKLELFQLFGCSI